VPEPTTLLRAPLCTRIFYIFFRILQNEISIRVSVGGVCVPGLKIIYYELGVL
jgi:hypothetical protein